MNFDKLTEFISKLGFPTAIAIWFLWQIQAFMAVMSSNQAQIAESLRRLVEMCGK